MSSTSVLSFRTLRPNGKTQNEDRYTKLRENLNQDRIRFIDAKINSTLNNENQNTTNRVGVDNKSVHCIRPNQGSGYEKMEMQRQLKTMKRMYEDKVKYLEKEHDRVKQQMEQKIKQAYQEKNFWKNKVQDWERKELEEKKLKQKKQEVGKLSESFLEEKNMTMKQLFEQKQKNHQLMLQVISLESEVSKLSNQLAGYQMEKKIDRNEESRLFSSSSRKSHQGKKSLEKQNRHHHNSQKPLKSHHHSTHSQHRHSESQRREEKEIKNLRAQCQSLKNLIDEQNEEKMKKKLGQMNSKYAKYATDSTVTYLTIRKI